LQLSAAAESKGGSLWSFGRGFREGGDRNASPWCVLFILSGQGKVCARAAQAQNQIHHAIRANTSVAPMDKNRHGHNKSIALKGIAFVFKNNIDAVDSIN